MLIYISIKKNSDLHVRMIVKILHYYYCYVQMGVENGNYSAFRFLTVDAYLTAIPFYEKNGFKLLLSDDANEHTRLMYFDMMEL